jgi:hypothetical protein
MSYDLGFIEASALESHERLFCTRSDLKGSSAFDLKRRPLRGRQPERSTLMAPLAR